MLTDAVATFGTIAKHRLLTLELAKRDVFDRYSGDILGSVWAIIHPVCTIAVFLFIFGVIFAPTGGGDGKDLAVYMISGLLVWLVGADVLARGPTIVAGQAALVKQVVFPVEVLPIKTVLSTLPTLVIGTLGLLIYAAVSSHGVGLACLLLPLAAALLYAHLFGLALLLSALGVFLKDLKDIVQLLLMIGVYLAPIFYRLEQVPASVRPLLYLNPLTFYVSCFADATYYGQVERPWVWIAAAVWSTLSLVIGAFTFRRLKPQFGTFL